MANTRLIRRPEVEQLTGYRRSSIYARIHQGIFPPPITIGARSVAWIADEIHQVTGALINGKTQDQLKTLVTELIQRRRDYEGNVLGAAI